jgi:3-phosphoshikimate 1-carboxyvinyltransferase
MRPLVGVLCAGKGEFVLDGVERMRERPIIDLIDALKQVIHDYAIVYTAL